MYQLQLLLNSKVLTVQIEISSLNRAIQPFTVYNVMITTSGKE